MSKRMGSTWMAMAAALVAIALLAGCAGKGKKEADIWMFSMPEGKTLEYLKTENVDQEMEVMGQAMKMSFNKSMGFTMAAAGGAGTDLMAEVTIKSLEAGMKSPQGDFEADGSPAIGKSFMLTFSPLGKEIDMSGAADITFSQGPQGDRSVMPDFAALLPDLPGTPVKVGDTWTSSDEIPIEEQNSELLLKFDNLHTFLGYETMNGMKCAKVETAVTGSLTGTGEQMGAPLTFEGTMEGSETWYFAVEEGVLVSSDSNVATTATVIVAGPQEMTIPLSMNMTGRTELVK